MNDGVSTPDFSSEQRAERLKQARKIAGLSLKQMTDKGEINYNTLCGWETAKHGGLTEKGALKVVKRLAKEGVDCSVEWLLFGVGQEPKPPTIIRPASHWKYASEFIEIHKAISKELHPEFIGTYIQGLAMAPHFIDGDYIAGKELPMDLLPYATGTNILVKLVSGEVIFRELRLTKDHIPILVPTNPDCSEEVLYDPNIQQWAKVLYHLRNEPLYGKRGNNNAE